MSRDKYIEILIERNRDEERPEMLRGPFPYYDHERSRYPERIRMCFSDGSTQIYEIRTEQPAPVILENIEIIRRMKVGYPPRRRYRK